MKHARDDYARIQDPKNLIPTDEPVFLLRGQDALSARTLRFYANAVRDYGGDFRIVEMCLQQAANMERWQRDVKCKCPDLPNAEDVNLPVQARTLLAQARRALYPHKSIDCQPIKDVQDAIQAIEAYLKD